MGRCRRRPRAPPTLLKASSVPPLLLSFAASLLGENLDLLVPQRWRQWRHFLPGGFAVSARPALRPWGVYLTHLVLATRSSPLSPTPLILPSLHFTRHHIWLHRSFSLADALPPCWSKSVQVDALPPLNGCAYWWTLCHLSWFGRMLCRCGSSSPSADALPLGILVL